MKVMVIFFFLFIGSSFAIDYYPMDTSKIYQYSINQRKWVYPIACETNATDSMLCISQDTVSKYEEDDSLYQIHFEYWWDFEKDSTYVITYTYLNKDGTVDTLDQDMEIICQGRVHDAEGVGVCGRYRQRAKRPDRLTAEDSVAMGENIPLYHGNITVPFGDLMDSYRFPRSNHSEFLVDGIGMVRLQTYYPEPDTLVVWHELVNIKAKAIVGIENLKIAEGPFLSVFPNPMNTGRITRIQGFPSLEIKVIDLKGRLIRDLGSSKGLVFWNGQDLDGRNVASGTYIVRVNVGERVMSRRIVLMR